MFCSSCGKQIPDNTEFCGYCGARNPYHESDMEENLNNRDENDFSSVNEREEFNVYENRLESIENQVREQQKAKGKGGFKKVLLIPIIAGGIIVLAAIAALIFKDQLFPKSDETTGQMIQEEAGGNLQDNNIEEIPLVKKEETETEAQIPAAQEKSDVAVGDYITLGRYETDGNTANGSEDLSWQVLAVEGDRVLVISEYAIEAMPFGNGKITWSDSSLREWLNGAFLSQSFSDEERGSILPTQISTKSNPTYGTSSGSDTTDQVFLLSGEEAAKYFNGDTARKVSGTTYAVNKKLFVSKTGSCRWWLRDAGQSSGLSSVINGDGVIDYFGAPVSENRYGVRPVMWIQY